MDEYTFHQKLFSPLAKQHSKTVGLIPPGVCLFTCLLASFLPSQAPIAQHAKLPPFPWARMSPSLYKFTNPSRSSFLFSGSHGQKIWGLPSTTKGHQSIHRPVASSVLLVSSGPQWEQHECKGSLQVQADAAQRIVQVQTGHDA